jgi:hypothetical protein
VIGRIFELIVPEIRSSSDVIVLATIEIFQLGSQRHPDFNMPILCRPTDGLKYVTFSVKVSACFMLTFLYNLIVIFIMFAVHSFPIFCSA